MPNDYTTESYVANCPISMPVRLRDVTPEVDLGGVMFSYDWGLVYAPNVEDVQIRPPQF